MLKQIFKKLKIIVKKGNLFHINKPGDNPPKDVYCIVEIPKGSNKKYEYNRESGLFVLDRVLSKSFFYPVEYGFIPQAWNKDDNDPLDIMIFTSRATFSGCVINCRPIGVLNIIDSGEKDDKIIGVPNNDPIFDHVKTLNDIENHKLKEIEHFFVHYKDSQEKNVLVKGWGDIKAAEKIINESIEEYKKKF